MNDTPTKYDLDFLEETFATHAKEYKEFYDNREEREMKRCKGVCLYIRPPYFNLSEALQCIVSEIKSLKKHLE